ncbi:sce7725 family protein [Lacticaseibacillus rhamnosus]
MYFPLLRGKQFELIALRELLENHLLSGKITPIIEPIRATSTFKSVLMLFQEKQRNIAVIQNPAVVSAW